MAKQMQHSMPASMQRYIGPYMEQNIMSPQLTNLASSVGSSMATPHAPVNLSRFTPQLSQAQPQSPPVQPKIIQPAQSMQALQAAQPAQFVQPQQPPQALTQTAANGPQVSYAAVPDQVVPAQPYDFITNPAPVPKPSALASLPGSNSIITRIGLVVGGLVVVLIIFSVLRGLLSGGSNLPLYMTVLEDQQALIHLTTNANTPTLIKNLSLTDQNFTATAQLSLTSSQTDLAALLQANKLKINTNLLNAKISPAVDTQLANAATAGTYDQTYQEIMKTGLTHYQQALNAAYLKAGGTKSRALLKSDYVQAGLLLQQLNAASAS